MNVKKEALRDAHEFARAQVFFGEGAGNRRKLIATAVAAKAEQSPAYKQAFEAALAVQDMSEHVRKAKKERRRRDFTHALNKNTRNAMSGRYTGVNMTVVVLAGAAYYAHHTGYDKKLYLAVRNRIEKAKAKHETKMELKEHEPKTVYRMKMV